MSQPILYSSDPSSTGVKPGWQTTEFWVTVFTSAIGAFVAIAGLFGHNLDGSRLQPLIPMAALIAVGIANAWYSHSRAQVKASAPAPLPPIQSLPPAG